MLNTSIPIEQTIINKIYELANTQFKINDLKERTKIIASLTEEKVIESLTFQFKLYDTINENTSFLEKVLKYLTMFNTSVFNTKGN